MKYSGRLDEADLILGDILEELEVPPSKQDEARTHYTDVGEWLNKEDSDLAEFEPEIYAHGSFAIGTAVQPIRKQELDVDAACVLKLPEGYDQLALKAMVGGRLKAHLKYRRMLEPPEGGKRCWTLQYSESTRFHLDILPAVPDETDWLISAGVEETFAKHALRITDTRTWHRANYWPRSNPKGYAEWFKTSMRRVSKVLEKRADVEAVPLFEVNTSLQQVIKILKRHRDTHFERRENRPISIIITTLAARAYQGEQGILATLRAVVDRMRNILFVNGKYVPVLNPVNPMEDFTDKWKTSPELALAFSQWLDAIEREHDSLLRPGGFDTLNESLSKSYGRTDAAAALAKHASRQTAYPTTHRARPSLLTPPAPHRRSPPWPMNSSHIIGISCSADRDGRHTHTVESGESLSKHWSLSFKASLAVPYDELYWQVVNTGLEAQRAKQMRGDFEPGSVIKHESTLYSGVHWVQCFALRSGVCIAQSDEFFVKIID